jgi:hypothetical protein
VDAQAAGKVRQFVKNARMDGRAVKVREVVEKDGDSQNAGSPSADSPSPKFHKRKKQRHQAAAA